MLYSRRRWLTTWNIWEISLGTLQLGEPFRQERSGVFCQSLRACDKCFRFLFASRAQLTWESSHCHQHCHYGGCFESNGNKRTQHKQGCSKTMKADSSVGGKKGLLRTILLRLLLGGREKPNGWKTCVFYDSRVGSYS